jgi:DsbC/DsbD-like thiol-disulfide interchange protein
MVTSSTFCRNAARTFLAVSVVLAAAVGASSAFAHDPGGDDGTPVELKAKIHPSHARAGRTVAAVVELHIGGEYHIQAHKPKDPSMIATVLTWDPAPRLRVGRTAYPAPESEKLAFAEGLVLVYDGTIKLRTPVTVKAGTKPGSYKLTGSLRYQACNAAACLAPARLPVELTVVVKR